MLDVGVNCKGVLKGTIRHYLQPEGGSITVWSSSTIWATSTVWVIFYLARKNSSCRCGLDRKEKGELMT